jgi:cbb3-type cytochrome oxidase subunit 1
VYELVNPSDQDVTVELRNACFTFHTPLAGFIRLLGGTLFLSGMFIMAWNTFKTLGQGKAPEFKAAEPAIWGEHA